MKADFIAQWHGIMWSEQFSIIDPFYIHKYICVWIQCVLQNNGHKKH